MTTARTRASLFQPRSTSAISARMGVSQALSFHGLLSVTVAMPPVTSVWTGRSFVFDMSLNVSAFVAVLEGRLRAACDACQRQGVQSLFSPAQTAQGPGCDGTS